MEKLSEYEINLLISCAASTHNALDEKWNNANQAKQERIASKMADIEDVQKKLCNMLKEVQE